MLLQFVDANNPILVLEHTQNRSAYYNIIMLPKSHFTTMNCILCTQFSVLLLWSDVMTKRCIDGIAYYNNVRWVEWYFLAIRVCIERLSDIVKDFHWKSIYLSVELEFHCTSQHWNYVETKARLATIDIVYDLQKKL